MIITNISTVLLLLFTIAILGILINRKNILILIMCLELMLLAINLLSVIYSITIDDIFGQVFSLYILCIAGAESSIGLAILITYYRLKETINVSHINTIKG